MSDISEALMWDGVHCVISVFLVHTDEQAPPLNFSTEEIVPARTKIYDLVAEEDRLPGLRVTEYDLIFDEVPAELADYLDVCLRRACEAGPVAWLGFEGSFHFDHLLTSEIATQIYGVCAAGAPVKLALGDEDRADERWGAVLRQHADALSA